jgi:hypothetical protein
MSSPSDLAVSPNGQYLFVACTGASAAQGGIEILAINQQTCALTVSTPPVTGQYPGIGFDGPRTLLEADVLSIKAMGGGWKRPQTFFLGLAAEGVLLVSGNPLGYRGEELLLRVTARAARRGPRRSCYPKTTIDMNA